MSVFTMLVGLPGSGKSTFAAGLRSSGEEFTYLSTDALIDAYGAAKGKTYDEVFEDYIGEATDIVFTDLRASLALGNDIVWDRTNLTPKSRRRVLSKIPKRYEIRAHVFEVPEELRQARILKRPGKTIPAFIDKNMRESFSVPVHGEGFDEIHYHNAEEFA